MKKFLFVVVIVFINISNIHAKHDDIQIRTSSGVILIIEKIIIPENTEKLICSITEGRRKNSYNEWMSLPALEFSYNFETKEYKNTIFQASEFSTEFRLKIQFTFITKNGDEKKETFLIKPQTKKTIVIYYRLPSWANN